MGYGIGLLLAVGVAVLAATAGLDRERAFYPTVLIVVASYYVLFAAMGGAWRTVAEEIIFAGLFALIAIVGFRKNLWIVAVALMGHGIFDLVHQRWIENAGVPRWWPGFCLAFDVVLGAWLAIRLGRRRSVPEPGHAVGGGL